MQGLRNPYLVAAFRSPVVARRGKVTEAHGLGRLVGGIFQVGAQHSGNFQRNPGK